MGATNLKSNIAELAVATECAKRNWVVCFPYGENTPYDILVDTGEQFLKVQVKYVTSKKDVINIPLQSTTGVEYKNTVDAIAAFCPCNNKVYWLDLNTGEFNDIGTYVRLRLAATKNNQLSGVRFSDNYDFAALVVKEARDVANV